MSDPVIGFRGWSFIYDSASGTPYTYRMPARTVRPLTGSAGQTMVPGASRTSRHASRDGPILPCGVESKVEEILSCIFLVPSCSSVPTDSAVSL